MSTHSAIGRSLDGGDWEAVYCQWNGQPREQIPAIFRLVLDVHAGDIAAAGAYLLCDCRKGLSVFNGAGVIRTRVPEARLAGENVDYVYPPSGPDLIVRAGEAHDSGLRSGSWLYLLDADGLRVLAWPDRGQRVGAAASFPRQIAVVGWEPGCPAEGELERLEGREVANA